MTMASNKRFWLGLILGLVLGAITSWGFGRFRTGYHPVEESKLCYIALTEPAAKLHPQTREYLKARYYWNAAVWLSPDWMAGWQVDFGPVDDNALAGLDPYKDASGSAEVYNQARTKHRLKP